VSVDQLSQICITLKSNRIRIRSERSDPNPHYSGKSDPDSHQIGKLDPYPNPHECDANPQLCLHVWPRIIPNHFIGS
jgi:hypothetical protein